MWGTCHWEQGSRLREALGEPQGEGCAFLSEAHQALEVAGMGPELT